jgi:hypothetical protein
MRFYVRACIIMLYGMDASPMSLRAAASLGLEGLISHTEMQLLHKNEYRVFACDRGQMS